MLTGQQLAVIKSEVNDDTQQNKWLDWLGDSRYVPVDFHFGGQHTSLTEDETGSFGLWTRRMDLHVSASCCHLSRPQGLPYLLLHLVAKVISLVSLSLLSSFIHIQKQSVSHPVPPPLFKAPGSGWFLPFSYVRCQRVSQRAAEPCEQSSSWVFPMAAAVRFDHGSSAGVSRQQDPDPTHSGLCGGGSWGEITAVASHSLAQLRRTPVGMLGGGGILAFSFPLSLFFLLSGSLC